MRKLNWFNSLAALTKVASISIDACWGSGKSFLKCPLGGATVEHGKTLIININCLAMFLLIIQQW